MLCPIWDIRKVWFGLSFVQKVDADSLPSLLVIGQDFGNIFTYLFISRLMVKIWWKHTYPSPVICYQADNNSLIRTEKLPQFFNIVISFSVVGLPEQDASWISYLPSETHLYHSKTHPFLIAVSCKLLLTILTFVYHNKNCTFFPLSFVVTQNFRTL